ncbi:LysR family transcriptional regulator [Taklimakanibacter lacteus]|uniref:LysR family transcriptional regulator n=1 Tax=Taklimakanibacter lacteus TaxID=2268456 RepID=UPI000E66D5C2
MRPSLLKTFLVVANSRNITRAASQLHLAQSSVSDQVQVLETELGTNLFARSRTGLELTPAGEVLKPYAEEILALLDEARAAVGTAVGQAAGSLAIGTLETIAAARMPPWLAAFRGSHPNITVRMKIAGSGTLLQMLESGDIDIAFCFDKGELDERFFKRPISTEPLVLLAPPDERPASSGDGLRALAGRSFVATEVGCVYRYLFDKAFAEAGIAAPHLAAEVDSVRTILRLVAAGAGLALVPRLAVVEALDAGGLVEYPWPGPVQTASLVAIWRRRRVQPAVLRQFLAMVDAAFTPLRPGDARPRHAVSFPS